MYVRDDTLLCEVILTGPKVIGLIQGEPKKCSNTKITISQKCVNIFVKNFFTHLFTRQLRKSVLFCAVFTRHTPDWRKRKLQERILQLNRRLTLSK